MIEELQPEQKQQTNNNNTITPTSSSKSILRSSLGAPWHCLHFNLQKLYFVISECPECSFVMLSKIIHNDCREKTKCIQLEPLCFFVTFSLCISSCVLKMRWALYSEKGLFRFTESIDENLFNAPHPTIFVGEVLEKSIQLEYDEPQIVDERQAMNSFLLSRTDGWSSNLESIKKKRHSDYSIQ